MSDLDYFRSSKNHIDSDQTAINKLIGAIKKIDSFLCFP